MSLPLKTKTFDGWAIAQIVTSALLSVGAFNLLTIGLFNLDLIKVIVCENKPARRVLFAIFGLCFLYLLFFSVNPAIQTTVFPESVVTSKAEGFAAEVDVRADVGVEYAGYKVVYWASDPDALGVNETVGRSLPTSRIAFGNFGNAGVTTVDSEGIARIQLPRFPIKYLRGLATIGPRVYYRVQLDKGYFSDVKWVNL